MTKTAALDKELLELVFDNVENGIYLVDGRGVTIRVNRTFEEMSGFSNAELAGRSLYDLVGPDNYFTGSASLLVLERKVPVTATYSTKTGRKLLVRGKPIFDRKNNIRYIINTIWDLTFVQYNRPIDADTARSQMLTEEDIITLSERMSGVIDLALRVAKTDSTILLSGESGVGKGLLAKLVHHASERRQRSLVQINCAAIPESLLEAELFGYEPGAFTGADRKGKEGLLQRADGGTLFLDEIGELPLHLQAKLLGVLQEQTFFKIGGREPLSVDLRLIAASNRDLAALVATGGFREDLYYRLNVVPIHLPPLRERREDIPLLIDYFADHYNRKYQSYKRISPRVVQQLSVLPWKGNIRELENTVERLIVTSRSNVIDTLDPQTGIDSAPGGSERCLQDLMQAYENEILLNAMQRLGTTRKVAKALGISQATAARKLKGLRMLAGRHR
ncbi:MAG: sigma-54 interaction domain-containing protein [Desulfuromonadales bacterium]